MNQLRSGRNVHKIAGKTGSLCQQL